MFSRSIRHRGSRIPLIYRRVITDQASMFGRKTNRSFDEKRIKDSQRFSSASTVKVPSSVRIEEDQFIPTFSPDYNENEEGPSFSTSDYPSGNETPLPAGRYRLAIVFLKIDPLSNVITAGTTDHVFPFIASKPFSSIEIHQFPYNQQGQLYDIGIALASDSPKINSPFVVYDVIPAINQTLTSFRSSPEGGRSLRLCPVWYHARPHVPGSTVPTVPQGRAAVQNDGGRNVCLEDRRYNFGDHGRADSGTRCDFLRHIKPEKDDDRPRKEKRIRGRRSLHDALYYAMVIKRWITSLSFSPTKGNPLFILSRSRSIWGRSQDTSSASSLRLISFWFSGCKK